MMDMLKHFGSVFEAELLAEIEKHGERVSLKKDAVILEAGQTIRTIPLLVSGVLKILREEESGKELLLYYLLPGETCAMTFSCCMERQLSEIRVVAEEDVEMVILPAGLVNDWLVKYRSWRNFIMRTIRNRLNELVKTIDQIAFRKLDERLIHFLRQKSGQEGSPLINISHEQISRELATSRVVISRLLKKLENDKKLLLYRNQIRLLGKW